MYRDFFFAYPLPLRRGGGVEERVESEQSVTFFCHIMSLLVATIDNNWLLLFIYLFWQYNLDYNLSLFLPNRALGAWSRLCHVGWFYVFTVGSNMVYLLLRPHMCGRRPGYCYHCSVASLSLPILDPGLAMANSGPLWWFQIKEPPFCTGLLWLSIRLGTL